MCKKLLPWFWSIDKCKNKKALANWKTLATLWMMRFLWLINSSAESFAFWNKILKIFFSILMSLSVTQDRAMSYTRAELKQLKLEFFMTWYFYPGASKWPQIDLIIDMLNLDLELKPSRPIWLFLNPFYFLRTCIHLAPLPSSLFD